MNQKKLAECICESDRFVEKAKLALYELQKQKREEYSFGGTKKSAAVRRVSMDLTRALADLRKPE